MQRKTHARLLPALLFVMVAAACTPVAPTEPAAAQPTLSATRPPPTETLMPTHTGPPEPAATGSPAPINTPTITPTPTATPNTESTQAIAATLTEEAFLAEVEAVLETHGFARWQGALSWVHPEPIRLDTADFGALVYEPVAGDRSFRDFVLHVAISEESRGGQSGCGVIFRSAPDLLTGEQYMLRTQHLSGQPAWMVERWDEGDVQFTLRAETSPEMQSGEGASNQFVLVLEGTTLTLYANDHRQSGLTINLRLSGRIAFLVWQESGISSCTFEDAWIWEIQT